MERGVTVAPAARETQMRPDPRRVIGADPLQLARAAAILGQTTLQRRAD